MGILSRAPFASLVVALTSRCSRSFGLGRPAHVVGGGGAKGARATDLFWFGLVCRRLPELKVPNLHFSLMCTISSSEVPTPFKRGARAAIRTVTPPFNPTII